MPTCAKCGTASDYPHDSTCQDCGAPHAHPGTHECADRHACDVRALTQDMERRRGADRELVLAVDELLREAYRVCAALSAPSLALAHDKVRRLITSDIYQSELGVRL